MMNTLLRVAVLLGFGLACSGLHAQVKLESGYAGNWTNRPGQPADFYISATGTDEAAELVLYDRLSMPRATFTVPVKQQKLDPENLEPWKNGHGFEPTTIELPDLPSGVYMLDGPELTTNNIPFIINEPTTPADVVVVFPTNTITAYSQSPRNGNTEFTRYSIVNLYSRDVDGNFPESVSFHRPQNRKVWLPGRFDKWLLETDYSFKYISDAELDSYDSIAGSKLVIIPGHSEYWTKAARQNFDKFVDSGGSSLVLSGNTMFREVELDDSENPTQLLFNPRKNFGPEYPSWQSIGLDFKSGGNGSDFPGPPLNIDQPYDGYKMLDVSPSYLQGTDLEVGDIFSNPTVEWDGVPFTSLDPVTGPVIDEELLGFHDIKLIGFDNATYGNMMHTAGAWVDFRKTEESGRVINVGSMSWTVFAGEGAELKKTVTGNMMDLLLIDQADFDRDEQLTASDIDLLLAEKRSESPRMRFDLTEDQMVSDADADRWLADFYGTTYGDTNLDHRIDFPDFLQFFSNFAQEGSWEDGDFNGDGYVAFSDLLQLSANYGLNFAPPPNATSVPEPDSNLASIVLVVLASSHLRRRRRLSSS